MRAMAPNAEDCETARLNAGQGRRVLPDRTLATEAWTENEDVEKSPGESRRLLPPPGPPAKSRLQAGLTLGVHAKYPRKNDTKIPQKTKFQKRKEKLIDALRPPYFILCTIIVNVCVHASAGDATRGWLEWSPAVWRHEPWRLLTYGLVHASAAHLALNCLVALAVGWRLEREQGWWRVLAVWGAGVACGALGAGALQPRVRVVGASAAVYALLMAHLPNVCLRFGHIPLWWFRPLSVLVLGASEGCWALVRSGGGGGGGADGAGGEHVAWAAHTLGAAVGVPLAFIVFTGENDKKTPIVAARIVSALLLMTGAALAVVHYTFWTEPDHT